ncbi:low-specificity L-threonine aldolase [bacterium]|nr:low-specificity L-threonine aldolase [bacterium]
MTTDRIHLDFRSDTVTKPTPAMREAMAKAEVGDDVYKEDPTIIALQEKAAALTGHEAGLFVPSGTMGNLASILAHCQRGDEIIVGKKAHTFLFEAAGAAALGGINIQTIPNQPDGSLLLEDIENGIRPEDMHQPVTRLVSIENTHNRCNGAPLSAEYTNSVAELAHKHGLKFHIDGARIFNAAVDQGIPVSSLTQQADSVTFCLSKGLSAPVGSVICGSNAFIEKALRVRKQLGGGMRQAGILAAAGIVALDTMVDRLADDHKNAKALALGLAKIPGIVIDTETQHTNMVYFSLEPDIPFDLTTMKKKLAAHGLLVGGGSDRIRMVTHAWVDTDSITSALEIVSATLSNL